MDDRHPELVDRNEKAMVDARKHFYETGYLNGHVRFWKFDLFKAIAYTWRHALKLKFSCGICWSNLINYIISDPGCFSKVESGLGYFMKVWSDPAFLEVLLFWKKKIKGEN